MKKKKKKITYKDLVLLEPCYQPKEIGIKSNYSATIPEFIREYRDKVKNTKDIILVLCRKDHMTERDMRLFAVWCAREALKLIDNLNPISIPACDVAEKYIRGETNTEKLNLARARVENTLFNNSWWDSTVDVRLAKKAILTATDRDVYEIVVFITEETLKIADAAGVRNVAKDAQIDKLLTYFE